MHKEVCRIVKCDGSFRSMVKHHGTLKQFQEACQVAWSHCVITTDELNAAVDRYAAELAEAKRGGE